MKRTQMQNENNRELISVIAPVYNVEKYLDQFIASVLRQSYPEFELILVEDCSADNSLEIAQRYARLDSRVKLVRQEKNGGCSRARNRGIAETKGAYVMEADSDDYLSADALELSYGLMKKTGADIVYAGFYRVYGNEIVKNKFHLYRHIYSREEAIHHALNHKTLSGYVWAKLYKREVLNGWEGKIDPEDMCSGDDGVSSFRALLNADKIFFTPAPIYYYRIRDDSMSGRGRQFGDNDLDAFKQVTYIKSALEQKTGDGVLSNKKLLRDLDIFIFMLFRGTLKKYDKSDMAVKEKFLDAGMKLRSFCDVNWRKVLWYSFNPRVKLEALKYGMKKREQEKKTWATKGNSNG